MLDDRPILVVHPDKRLLKTVHRIVGGTFRPVIVAPDLEMANALCNGTPPFIAIVEHHLLEKNPFSADTPVLVLMQQSPDELAPMIEGGAMSYLMANPMPLLAEELASTVAKLSRRQIFGLEKYLAWGIEIRERTLTDPEQRRELVEEIQNDVQRASLGPRAGAAALIADELISNAVYNAPVDAAGAHVQRDDGAEPRGKTDRDVVTLRYACDARYLAIEVEDRYGSIDRNTILRSLTKAASRTQNKVSRGTRGAGIGLASVYGSCNHLVFNLDPGRRTQVIALIDVRFRPAELGNTTCSFGIFQASATDEELQP
jgi:hypothetical protein